MKAEKKNNNSKVVWYVLFAVVAVILGYMFTVVYFFYISPYNISTKTAIWPFLSNQQVGEFYLDATVEINFSVENENFEIEDKSVVGVNVREDGFIIAPYSDFPVNQATMSDIEIKANNGKVFKGIFLYGDRNYNLAILKCENLNDTTQAIRLPYVSVPSSSNSVYYRNEVLAISSPLQDKTIWEGRILSTDAAPITYLTERNGKAAVEMVIEDCYVVELESESGAIFEGGAVFNTSGRILGLSFGGQLSSDDGTLENCFLVMPIDKINLFLNDVIVSYKNEKTYTNDLVKGLKGFDRTELQFFLSTSSENLGEEDYFWFDGEWCLYSDQIRISYAESTIEGYYVFKDWVYKENTILKADNVISLITCNGKSYSAKTKTSLMKAFYDADAGDEITIYYYDVNSLGGDALSTSVIV